MFFGSNSNKKNPKSLINVMFHLPAFLPDPNMGGIGKIKDQKIFEKQSTQVKMGA